MGRLDKIPIITERRYAFQGIFEIKHLNTLLRDFLEHSRHYDWTEKEFEERNDGGERRLVSKVEALQEYSDYYRVILRYELLMEGKDVIVQEHGREHTLTKGRARLIINMYIEPDFANRRKITGSFSEFLYKTYDKIFQGDELGNCIYSSVSDVNQMIAKFKDTIDSHIK